MSGEKKKIRENPCKSMRKIINEKNLCESVKSVGLKESMRKNLRHLRNLRDKLIFSEKKKTAEKKKPAEKKKQKSLRNLSKSEALH